MQRRNDAAGDGTTDSAARAALRTGVILGIGAMGAIDEIIFHQLLQWHHFYHDTSERRQIVSDGLLHLFTLAMLVLGALLLWRERRRLSVVLTDRPFWAGVLLGLGGFQLFDGIVNHKLPRLHQIHEHTDNLLPYDLAWNVGAALLLLAGWALWRRHRADSVGQR
jgi:uncharacterized membrane protein